MKTSFEQEKPQAAFTPVTVTITFETPEELAAAANLLGGLHQTHVETAVANSSERLGGHADKAWTFVGTLYDTVSTAYRVAA